MQKMVNSVLKKLTYCSKFCVTRKSAQTLYANPVTLCLSFITVVVTDTNSKNMVLLTSLRLHSLHVLVIIV